MSRSAILLSGGLDSCALAFLRRPDLAITIDYGQLPAAGEIRAAAAIADELRIEHEIITVDLGTMGSGDLAGAAPLDVAPVSEWWPFRNQLLVTLAAMRGVGIGVTKLLLGTVKGDELHADGRREFVEAMDALLKCQEGGVVLEAPAMSLTAPELIRISAAPWETLAWSHSCHVSEYACGVCRGCHKHYHTLEALGVGPY